VSQPQTFLQRSRFDRFFALWVLEATSGMRRCELAGARHDLLDLDAGTLEIGHPPAGCVLAASRSRAEFEPLPIKAIHPSQVANYGVG
jgi:hypothetical protein